MLKICSLFTARLGVLDKRGINENRHTVRGSVTYCYNVLFTSSEDA